MKKLLCISILFIAFTACSLTVLSCKKNVPAEYFSLNIIQSTGGTVTASLENGSIENRKYLAGSVLSIKATIDKSDTTVYGFEKLIIGENETTVTNYRLTIIADTTVRAVFYVIPQAATVLSRIEAAFQNTYEFDNLDVFDGISGKIIQSIIDQNNISYKLTTEFCFTIDSSDTFIFTEIEMLTKEGNIPLLSIYYIDSEIFGGARLYFDMLALENYYYIETATIREIFGTLDAENDTDLGENSEYFSANLLELLGIVYDIENTDKYSSISFNLSAIFELIAELLQSEPNFDFGFLNIIPQLDIVLNVEYKTVLSKECIRDISYTLTCENDENTTLYGNIDKIELESGIQSQASFNPESITKSTVNDIVDMLIWLFEIIRY